MFKKDKWVDATHYTKTWKAIQMNFDRDFKNRRHQDDDLAMVWCAAIIYVGFVAVVTLACLPVVLNLLGVSHV